MMNRKSENMDFKPRSGKYAGRVLVFFLLAGAALLGWYAGFNLHEEKRSRIRKLMFEAREMPFRIFV